MPFQKKSKKTEDVDLSKVGFAELEKDYSKDLQKEQVRNANKLVHCIVTCLDPDKSQLQGEIFSAMNASTPEIKKMVVFGTPTHVPQILLNVIKEKKYQAFVRDPNNRSNRNMSNKTKLVPSYNVQILEPLTADEYDAIRKRQLAEGYGSEEGDE